MAKHRTLTPETREMLTAIADGVRAVAGRILNPNTDDPHKAKREALPPIEAIAAARERLAGIDARVKELNSRPLSQSEKAELEQLHGHHRASTEHLRRTEEANGRRREYAPLSLAIAHKRTRTEFYNLTARRTRIIERAQTLGEELRHARNAAESAAKNLRDFRGDSLADENTNTQRRLRVLETERDELFIELEANAEQMRDAWDARAAADDAICDFCGCPRRNTRPVESCIAKIPAAVLKLLESRELAHA